MGVKDITGPVKSAHPEGGGQLPIEPRETFPWQRISLIGFIQFFPNDVAITGQIDKILTGPHNQFGRAEGNCEAAPFILICTAWIPLDTFGWLRQSLNNFPKGHADGQVARIGFAQTLIFDRVIIAARFRGAAIFNKS